MRLLPYSYSLAAMSFFKGYTPMRGLAMDFPGDRNVHTIADQFMYGPALLAAPVTEPMVHFPNETLEPFGTDDLEARVDLATREIRVRSDGNPGVVPAIQEIVRRLGHEARPRNPGA